MEIKDMFLDIGEYFPIDFKKTIIYLHHTAGSHRPDWVINAWNKDQNEDGSTRRIATSFVIGGKSTRDGDGTWDGVILRSFPETNWAWHLGVGGTNGVFDKVSIGIEMCNYGPMTKTKTGEFMTYVNTPVPEDQVVKLETPFRSFNYYHKYTDKQISSLRWLLIYLGNKFGVNLRLGLQENIKKESFFMPNNLSILEQQKWLNSNGYVGKNGNPLKEDGMWGENTAWAVQSIGKDAFEYNSATMKGHPGIWSHSNIRTDKTDCSPQPALKNMLLSL